jgi:beta-phosphoglucomutase
MLKGIIFDMDGVLIDSHAVHRATWKQFNQRIGRDVSDSDLEFILDGRRREEILKHFLGDISPQAMAEYGRLKDEIFQKVADKIEPIPGLERFLDRAEDKGVIMGVATSATASRAENMLSRLQLKKRFATIVTSADEPSGKPDPALFLLAARQMAVQPEETLVFEDSVSGIQAAKAAGMKCFAVASSGREALLQAAGPDALIPDFQDPGLLDRASHLYAAANGHHNVTAARVAP